jgi:hypothetical protein
LVDSTTLIVLASIVQTVVITLTLLVFIFQFRSQEKSLKEAAYQNVVTRYTDYIRMLVDKPELGQILADVGDGNSDSTGLSKLLATAKNPAAIAYIILGYGIFEEIFSLYKKKWIDEETWNQWSTFLERYARQSMFSQVHQFTKGTFDKDFEDYVDMLLNKK